MFVRASETAFFKGSVHQDPAGRVVVAAAIPPHVKGAQVTSSSVSGRRTNAAVIVLTAVIALIVLIVATSASGHPTHSFATASVGSLPSSTLGTETVFVHWANGKTERVIVGRKTKPSRAEALATAQTIATALARQSHPRAINGVRHTASARKAQWCDEGLCYSYCDGWIGGPSYFDDVHTVVAAAIIECSWDVSSIFLQQWITEDWFFAAGYDEYTGYDSGGVAPLHYCDAVEQSHKYTTQFTGAIASEEVGEWEIEGEGSDLDADCL
jgi:hypothetical protein